MNAYLEVYCFFVFIISLYDSGTFPFLSASSFARTSSRAISVFLDLAFTLR